MSFLNVSLNLDDLWVNEAWEETIAGIIRDELRLAVKNEVKRRLKEDSSQLRDLVGAVLARAFQEAVQNQLGEKP